MVTTFSLFENSVFNSKRTITERKRRSDTKESKNLKIPSFQMKFSMQIFACLHANAITVESLNFVVVPFSWNSWIPLIHEIESSTNS